MIPALKGLFQGIIGIMMPLKHYCLHKYMLGKCYSLTSIISFLLFTCPSFASHPFSPLSALPYTMENHSRLGKGEYHLCRTLAIHLQMYCPHFLCCLRFTSPVSCERISSGQESEMYSWEKAVLMFSSYTVTMFTQLKHLALRGN